MYTKLFCTWEYILLSHQYVFKNGLFQLSGGTSCLFTTLIWQVIERVHVVCSSWFSWRYESLLRFGIGGPRFFPRVAATMISKRFLKLRMKVYFWMLWKIWSKIWKIWRLVFYLSLLFTHLVNGPWRTRGWN